MPVCAICGTQRDHVRFVVREMIYGSREPFSYFKCSNCGCLQLEHIPPDLARHYPANYYSYANTETAAPGSRAWHYRLFKRLRAHPKSMWGKLFKLQEHYAWFGFLDPKPEARILDVGCGGGSLLSRLSACGFKNLTGVDPFRNGDVTLGEVKLLKRELEQLEGPYDLIMAHHSLEHVPDQQRTMTQVRRLLADGGMALIRIPILGRAWQTYGTDWMGIDAPRHIYLHSLKRFEWLARSCGFEIERVEFDGSDIHWWGSEQYRRDIALNEPGSYGVSRKGSVFSRRDILRYRRQAHDANVSGEGDAAVFYLRASKVVPQSRVSSPVLAPSSADSISSSLS